MARKTSANSDSARGFGDIIGVAFLALALLLLVAQWSFDRYDIIRDPPNRPAHNWVGPLGAQMAYYTFLIFGLAHWFGTLSYLKRRWPWVIILLLSCVGWLHLLDLPHLRDATSMFAKARQAISAPSVGGLVGQELYNKVFWTLGAAGAGIVYVSLDFISLLFLTNFQLGEWVRGTYARWGKKKPAASPQEEALERRARDLKKQAKKLEEEVERSGIGPDLKPVPEPTVRDLSVPQPKPSRGKKSVPAETPKEPEPAEEGEVITAREVAAATTAVVLG